ncbi:MULTISPECIES: hypothetical protein [Emticicia]|uniref:hypothetical protein n=1 Tax=Emticicia TaxID=312278 RepID=UPI0007D89840|nr:MULTISPECIES: hypothetical protein [Emticicia]
MNQLKQIITKVNLQLYTKAILVCLLVAGTAYYIILFFVQSEIWASIALFLSFLGISLQQKLFQNKQKEAIKIIHQKLDNTEYSLELLTLEQPNLAEQLQLERLLSNNYKTPIIFERKLLCFFGVFLLAFSFYNWGPKLKWNNHQLKSNSIKNQLSTNQRYIPNFESATLTITPPSYTNIENISSENMNASAVVGSMLKWQINFSNSTNLKVNLSNNRGEEVAFKLVDEHFEYTDQLISSGLYSFKAYFHDSLIYQSDYYRLDAIPDLSPKIEPTSKELYQLHFIKDSKNIQISAKISDDFLVNQAFIVATLARGSGENVKFREVKIPLSQSNFKSATISKTIDLRALNFTPGDELYYYWAAIDNKRPSPNFSKSDTYFIVYKDTAQVEESDLATMAMNIMPEYFRSQRQIIFDTEKLIAKRNKLKKQDFNDISNNIGFDQKALRLRYGQYLGEENEGAIGAVNALPAEAKDGDLLKGFRHDHDEGEHDHDEGNKHEEEGHNHGTAAEEKDPVASLLAEYVHSHDDGEANTYYEQSTKSLLKMSLEQMWQSELHLRLYEPEKALPFEKKALEYLKSAQHKARTFVKKTSFAPPPIKEKEKRLTGELTKFNSAFKFQKNYTQQQLETLIAEVMGIISENERILDNTQKYKLMELSAAISTRVVNSNLSNWSILSTLQELINGKNITDQEQTTLKTKMYGLINKSLLNNTNPSNQTLFVEKKLENAYWKNIKQ